LNNPNSYNTLEFQIMPGYNYNDKMKNKYHTVGTVPTYNRNFIKTEAKSIPHTHTHTHAHTHMTAHFPVLVQIFQ
jgi:hypothetical protein